MDENTEVWRKFYDKALSQSHLKRTEFTISLNESNLKVAIDCGCGVGNDIAYLENQGYQVYGFDINPDSIALCRNRFQSKSQVSISQSSFEKYDYPKAGIVIANSSLFFADPTHFESVWKKIESSLGSGGVFAGDFMGINDSWALFYRSPTTSLTAAQIETLFANFDIVRFCEREEDGLTSLGKIKHWHTFSVVAVKR
ncbi:class I SAM-dependent methyltransferase [Marinomonas polaris]|uniref:class I SAM-dependent methyltransferase n=1 Tax=Marinomonas polaris TaxID=293552 RepID=UPI003F9C0B93